MLVGPWTGVLAVSVVVIVQALLLADGGITALGTNIVLLSLVAVAVGWLVFVALAVFAGGAVGTETLSDEEYGVGESQQADKAYAQVQDIAVKAIEGSAATKSLAGLQQALTGKGVKALTLGGPRPGRRPVPHPGAPSRSWSAKSWANSRSRSAASPSSPSDQRA